MLQNMMWSYIIGKKFNVTIITVLHMCLCIYVIFRKLLKQPVPYHFQTSTIVSESSMNDIPHLWLCYWYEDVTILCIYQLLYFPAVFSLYLELVGGPKVASEYWPTPEDAYEAAVHSIHSPTGIRLAWKE